MICSNCQKEIADGSKFCYSCGAGQPGFQGPPAAAPAKRLMRSSRDKKIAGVCAGLADYFDLAPTIVRVVWLLAVIFAGAGFLVYIILWIVLPVAPARMPATVATTSQQA